MPKKNKKNKYNPFILLLLLIGLVIGLALVTSNELSPLISQAGKATEIYFSPSNPTFKLNSTENLTIGINPKGDKITAVELNLQYDPTMIRINNIRPANFFPTDEMIELKKDLTIPGRIRYAFATDLNSSFSSNTNSALAIIELTPLKPGRTNIAFITQDINPTLLANTQGESVKASFSTARITIR